jgi:hypothetical protein
MKVVSKSVNMIAWFQEDGKIRPLKFKLEEDENCEIIKVDQVINAQVEKYAGNVMQVFDCQSEINGVLKRYQLKYEIETTRWILFKI